MSQKIIDYTLDNISPANPDSSLPATVTGCAVVPGPGPVTLDGLTLPNALDFSGGGHLQVALPVPQLDTQKFCVRIVFRVDGPVTARQVLVESNALPLSLRLEPAATPADFNLVAEVVTTAFGPGHASTEFQVGMNPGTWYSADLVYDSDTLAIFIDGAIQSVHAFPDGNLAAGTADRLFVGCSAAGTDAFAGKMAALQLHADLPIELESPLDERRTHPQWFLTYKEEELKSSPSFGAPQGEFYYDLTSASWVQRFRDGIVMYHDSMGQAFALQGAILATYSAMPNRGDLGWLISDEMSAARAGARKSLFQRGGIYWSGGTGAVPVLDQIWVDYEALGESGMLGLPTAPYASVPGGRCQVFQQGQMYFKASGNRAFEVHGAILSRFLATGGIGAWGFPVTNESDVLSGSNSIGRQSEFEGATFFWSPATGAFEVHGDIRWKYKNLMGPAGTLGFPTSNEADVPGASAPARHNTFQRGSIVWFGSRAQTYACLPFRIHLGRIDTRESEGFLMGENDVYMHASIEVGGHVVHTERIPASGDSDGNNIYDAGGRRIGGVHVPNTTGLEVVFRLDVWDSDPFDDDHLGNYEYALNMANAWGLRNHPSGLIDSGAFDNINSIRWTVAPDVNEADLTDAQKWWGVQNRGTPTITYHQYAAAFSDVDSDTEWWDPTDWLEQLFYEFVIEDFAAGGNCFGMSLEAIYSKKHGSLLTLPLDRFTDWDSIRNEFNIRHLYQVGAPAIWWFVGQFLSGNTHDPVDVFHATRSAFASGCDPVLCLSQNYDFSGAAHCILPVGWDDSSKPWKILVRDPNFQTTWAGQSPRTVFIDPDANTFTYDGSSHYTGGEWSGGRLHYMPFDVLSSRPRTPIFEAIMLLVAGLIVILGGDSETTSLTDENGVDLDAFGADSIGRLQAKASLTNKFVSFKGFNESASIEDWVRRCRPNRDLPRPDDVPEFPQRPRSHGALRSEVHLRSERKRLSRVPPAGERGIGAWKGLTLREYLCQLAPASVRRRISSNTEFVRRSSGRLMHRLLDSPVLRKILADAVKTKTPATFPAVSKNFIHSVRGLRDGQLRYAVKQGFAQMELGARATTGEAHTVQVTDFGLPTNAMTVKSTRDKSFELKVHHRLGAGSDFLRMRVLGIPLAAGGELKLNVKPGLGGVEILSPGQDIKTMVEFEYSRRDTRLASRFDLAERGGLRIMPSTLLTSNQLKVSQINALLGDSLRSRLVSARP